MLAPRATASPLASSGCGRQACTLPRGLPGLLAHAGVCVPKPRWEEGGQEGRRGGQSADVLSWFPDRSLAGLPVFTAEGRGPAPGCLHSSLYSLLDSGGPWLLLLCWELRCPGDLPTLPGSQRWLLQLPPGSALCFWADHWAVQKRTISIPVYPHDSHKGPVKGH